jgi:hypothetical protein
MVLTVPLVAALLLVGLAAPAGAQDASQEDAVLAVVEASLEAISGEDMAAFAGYLLDETITIAVTADGETGQYSALTVDFWREMLPSADFVERGFDPEVRVSGPVATVWLPYDFYIDGELSHCGIDAFTLVNTPDGWRISGLTFTRQQPPACLLHPDGPPAS